jgi:hypothetical protein
MDGNRIDRLMVVPAAPAHESERNAAPASG